jgi:RNA polymerase sigma-70 factor (ECF subfamily)
MQSGDALAARFAADRRRLRGVAYRLLGSLADADDAVQASWLKISAADTAEIRNLSAWFTTVVARECLDQLRARKRRGEVPLEYGIAAAAPADEEILLAESVGRALLVVLDRLSPAQRVAFVLHDLFSIPFEEIGRILDRSAVAAKKLASRARERLRGAPSTYGAADFAIVEAFMAASRGGDLPALLDLLAPGVVRRVDRVLVPDHVPTEMRGARAVAEETKQFRTRARTAAMALVNGAPGIVLAPAGRLEAVLCIGIRDGRIYDIDIIGDPHRLAGITLNVAVQ